MVKGGRGNSTQYIADWPETGPDPVDPIQEKPPRKGLENYFSYEFEDKSIAPLSIMSDMGGVGGASATSDPAWCWRLWEGALAMSMHIERECLAEVKGRCVLELGSGTGLVGLACARLGAAAVVATDLLQALPVLVHNAEVNLGLRQGHQGECKARCPERHALASRIADCEDYICNVCDEDIDEGGIVWACRQCDFDMCTQCDQKAAKQDWSGMPAWFRVCCEAGEDISQGALWQSKGEGATLLAHALDWADAAGVHQLTAAMDTWGVPGPVTFVVAADVTYSMASVELLLEQLARLKADLPPTPDGTLKALVLHEPRGPELDEGLLQGLRGKGLPFKALDTAALPLERAADMTLLEVELRG